MFKRQNNNRFGFGMLSKYIFVSIFVLLFSTSISVFAFEVKLGDALDKMYDNYKRNSELNELNGKAIVDDIYGKSLETVRNDQMVPMLDAVDKTVGLLNKRYSSEVPATTCILDKQDVINILYFSNSEFKRDLKNNLMGFKKPQKDAMGKSCNKLNVCIYNPKGGQLRNTVTLNNACQDEINKTFVEYYLNSYYMQTVQGGNQGSNFFWNATLEDSVYDIMNDVANLAKILFEDVSEPAESHFYKMPKVDYQAIPVDDVINGNIDWFSPYNNSSASSSGTGGTNTGSGFDMSGGVGQNGSGTTGLDGVFDNDIIGFIEGTNFDVGGNPDSIVGGNQCFTGAKFEGALGYSSGLDGEDILTPGEYLSGLLGDLAEVSCNNDGVHQSWESNDCGDASASSSSGVSNIEQIETLLNAAAQQSGYDIEEDNPTLGCFQKCDDVPCNAISCDKIICYAKCSCMLYESPTFDPSITPGLTSVFKLQFCIVPVMENKLSTRKTVYNIAAIFTELYKVLQDLRNSGQLAINVKTKEFLDNGLKENNFGKQLSFSINSAVKPSFAQISELTQIQEQLDLNTSWMENILGFAKDPGLDNEKNKYIVMDDPCIYSTSKQIFSNPDQKAKIMEACHDERNKLIEMPETQIMETALQDQKTVLLDAEFESFLRQNRDFWIAVDAMFETWMESANVLRNKK